jgi:hypothetical protein
MSKDKPIGSDFRALSEPSDEHKPENQVPESPRHSLSGFRDAKFDGEQGAHLEHEQDGKPAGESRFAHNEMPHRCCNEKE